MLPAYAQEPAAPSAALTRIPVQEVVNQIATLASSMFKEIQEKGKAQDDFPTYLIRFTRPTRDCSSARSVIVPMQVVGC